MTERQGIEIDYCPECRGIWLDKGELDKLIEKSESAPSHSSPARPTHVSQPNDRRNDRPFDYDDDHDHDRHHHQRGRHGKKRGGFLGDIFEFGD